MNPPEHPYNPAAPKQPLPAWQPAAPYPGGAQGFPPFHPPQVNVHIPPTSGSATASLVFGILGILGGWCLFAIPCFLAVVFGHIGLAQTSGGRRGGRGLAVAGLILGYLFVIPALLIALGVAGALKR
ncbi:DUF4190 domain-containing protein [Herbidospora daliensis]|uniref:DUF4190 domain-containing protein n=1 Tax=Herbidospora daliensis TaxID=295585 RepID=UPI000783FC05|nr:DUF4190 domain-containing protein [Herbidospora daliensis]